MPYFDERTGGAMWALPPTDDAWNKAKGPKASNISRAPGAMWASPPTYDAWNEAKDPKE